MKSPENSDQYGSIAEAVQPVPEAMVWKYNGYPVNSKTVTFDTCCQNFDTFYKFDTPYNMLTQSEKRRHGINFCNQGLFQTLDPLAAV